MQQLLHAGDDALDDLTHLVCLQDIVFFSCIRFLAVLPAYVLGFGPRMMRCGCELGLHFGARGPAMGLCAGTQIIEQYQQCTLGAVLTGTLQLPLRWPAFLS